ncbi:phosphate-binding protein psts [Plakobranchus ocellatus]|uniref:Phosphate-binding protein psts n=1 Tax=Plakobranchus ocellatus TaxID=259542 RepID=A0AAV3ZC93_9GAST|nr:phosphate-binding protein psts [Plakobranchus ocellatus]
MNPNCQFPNERISVVARAQESGTTATFTSALAAFDQNWNETYGIFSKGMNSDTYEPYRWRPGSITHFGPKNEDVSSLILSIPYTLGYMSAGDLQQGMSVAALSNRLGQFVTVTTESLQLIPIQAAMDAQRNSDSLTVDLVNPDTPGSYPISSYTYFVMYGTKMQDCSKATELMRYILWFMTDQQALEAADNGFATLNEKIVSRVRSEVLSHVQCKGRLVLDLVEDQIAEENKTENTWIIPVAVTCGYYGVVTA